MMSLPLIRDLVFVGGGHTHALVLRRWAMKPLAGVRVTLITPGPTAAYSGMLPGHVAGHYDRDTLNIDLVRLARAAGARLVLDKAFGLDPAAKLVHLETGDPVGYDLCSIDVGIHTPLPDVPGFDEHGHPAKPLDAFADAWERFASGGGPGRVVVIGAGVAGVELAMAAAHRLRGAGRSAQVTLVDKGPALAALGNAARRTLRNALTKAEITLYENMGVAAIRARAVVLEDGREIASDFTLGAGGPRPHGWLRNTGLDLHRGYIAVDAQLRSLTDPSVYAVGDCAHLSHAPRPKAGVFAVREAPTLYTNLRADLTGSQRSLYRPQKDYLKLISMGGKQAIAEKNGFTLSGAWMWRWKDRIDRKFMDQFRELTPMAPPEPPSDAVRGLRAAMGAKPHCGGCGAKVGRGALRAALAHAPAPARKDVIALPGDDAAVLRLGAVDQVISTDHLRAFCEDPVLMARVSLNHAMGDVWAMGAVPQAALAHVTLPRLSPELQDRTLRAVMAEAGRAVAATGADLVGGHSSVGAELSLGFTVTGLLDRPAITLRGARPGDALILTRPIGTGTVLAAEMQLAARGGVVVATWRQMARPQMEAAEVLRASALAMTDVTGFGLAGHLLGICEASDVGANITIGAIPVLPGAEALAARGIRSTLWPENRAAVAGVAIPDTARGALLCDPQTAGGFLAVVPSEKVANVLTRLKAAGEPSAQIGRVTARAGQIDITE